MLFTSFHVVVLNLYIYIRETKQTLFKRRKEQVTNPDSTVKGHFDNFSKVDRLFFFTNFWLNGTNRHKFRLNLACHIKKIIDQSNYWKVLLFKETYQIKEKCSVFNNGVKASREMQFFWMPFNIRYIKIMFQLFLFILMSVKFYSHPDNYLNKLIEKLSFRSILCCSWLIILNFKVYRDVNFHISFYFTVFKTGGLI